MSSGYGDRRERSTAAPVEAGRDAPPGRSSATPSFKLSQLLALRSPSSVSKATTDITSGHFVVDVHPTATDDGDGSSNGPGDDDINIGRPAVHFVLAFDDLTYSVKRPRGSFRRIRNEVVGTDAGTRALLDGISGEAREGEILAVLGESGAGKSTLIDALADRIRRESLRGAVTLNGEPLDGRLLKVISAYVMQDDLLYPMLTVAETLMYSAEFRLPRALSASKKRSRVQALIDQLGLRAAANTIIGDEGRRGVSGGERRRVSIGIDIIHDPIILFLDEPTSGLDSTSAFMVVKVLQRIAQSGSVVIMSIHQPSYRILGLLDRLLFLSRGRTVYYGPPAGLSLFFSEFGYTIPEGENPAEFALDTIRELDGTSNGTKELVEFSKSWQEKPLSRTISAASTGPEHKPSLSLKEAIGVSIARGKLVSGTSPGGGSSTAANTTEVATYANPWWVEVWVLTSRAFTNTRRTPELFLIRLGTVTVTAFILATVFWRLDNTPKGVNERFGFFAIGMSTMFYTSADALPVFLIERYIYLRETAHNAYRRSSYTLSNAIVAFPPLVLLSLAFAAITFFAVGLAGGAQGFAFFVLIVLASFWAGSGFVTFLSAVVPHVIIGYTVVVAVLAYFLLFSGFFVTRDRIPGYWIWFHYLSLIKYPYQAVMQNEFGADPARCFMRGVQMFDGTPMGRLPEATKVNVLNAMSRSMRVDFNSSSCITAGPDILAKQAVTDLGKWACLWVTVAWGFLFRLLFYLTLLLGGRNKRR
ncbi:ABC transporter G family member 5 [Dichanthelium oligosanthes]|uniref:ABC transporter G family member 5 n=1 Tax=Dichanthelium oligosanthes TaxID=888268 RepID=A0A1E5VBS2_9POAL|nr:ABC transporter G family member 5 [Dichanthelium oligosanthes]